MAIEAVVCNAGLPDLVKALLGSGTSPGTNGLTLWAAVGVGAGVIAASNTTLFNEDTGTPRVAVVFSDTTTSQTGDTLTGATTFTFPVINETLTEIGYFTSSSHGSGDMIYHRAGFSTAVGPTAGVPAVAFTENIPLVPVVTP